MLTGGAHPEHGTPPPVAGDDTRVMPPVVDAQTAAAELSWLAAPGPHDGTVRLDPAARRAAEPQVVRDASGQMVVVRRAGDGKPLTVVGSGEPVGVLVDVGRPLLPQIVAAAEAHVEEVHRQAAAIGRAVPVEPVAETGGNPPIYREVRDPTLTLADDEPTAPWDGVGPDLSAVLRRLGSVRAMPSYEPATDVERALVRLVAGLAGDVEALVSEVRVRRAAGPAGRSDVPPVPHLWREYNAHGNTCHFPGCRLTEDAHPRELPVPMCDGTVWSGHQLREDGVLLAQCGLEAGHHEHPLDQRALTKPCDGSCGGDGPHDADLLPGAAEHLAVEGAKRDYSRLPGIQALREANDRIVAAGQGGSWLGPNAAELVRPVPLSEVPAGAVLMHPVAGADPTCSEQGHDHSSSSCLGPLTPQQVAEKYGYGSPAEMLHCETAGREVDAELDTAARAAGMEGGTAAASEAAVAELRAAMRAADDEERSEA